MEVPKPLFEDILDDVKQEKGVTLDTELDAQDLKEVVARYKELYLRQKAQPFPQEPKVQLLEAIKAVFRSWDNPALPLCTAV